MKTDSTGESMLLGFSARAWAFIISIVVINALTFWMCAVSPDQDITKLLVGSLISIDGSMVTFYFNRQAKKDAEEHQPPTQ